jgi:para-nitrobenzyl esterase
LEAITEEYHPAWPAAAPQDPTPTVMTLDVESKAVRAENDARYVFLDQEYRNN